MTALQSPETPALYAMQDPVDKQAVARHFSRAAQQYDSYAQLQRDIGQKLLTYLPAQPFGHGLDLGCGTGHFLPLLANQICHCDGLDLSSAMLEQAKQRFPQGQFFQGDAEALPLPDASYDLIFSNLALQWCSDLSQAMSEAWRCLRPGGWLLFSTLADGTLAELSKSWQALDGRIHVNRFLETQAIEQAVETLPWRQIQLSLQQQVIYYGQTVELLRELKGIGANYVVEGSAKGLTTPAQLKRLEQVYRERYALAQGLPATYQVIYAALQK